MQMPFLRNVFFLGSMRRFKKLLSTSSSTSVPRAETKIVVEKGLSCKAYMYLIEREDLSQRHKSLIHLYKFEFEFWFLTLGQLATFSDITAVISYFNFKEF